METELEFPICAHPVQESSTGSWRRSRFLFLPLRWSVCWLFFFACCCCGLDRLGKRWRAEVPDRRIRRLMRGYGGCAAAYQSLVSVSGTDGRGLSVRCARLRVEERRRLGQTRKKNICLSSDRVVISIFFRVLPVRKGCTVHVFIL